MKKIISITSVALALVIGFFLLGCDTSPTLDYVTIDINPSIDMVLDRNENVVATSALNKDGEILLLNLELEGEPVEDAIEDIIDESIDLGYIDPDSEEIVVEVGSENERIRERVRENVNNAFQERGMFGKAIAQENTELIEEAETLGVTPGFLRMAYRAIDADDTLTLETALTMTQKELITIINDKKDEMKMVASEQKMEFFAERTLLQETYLPQIQALEAEIAEIEAAEGDATEKIAELEALRTEFHDAMSELRLAYQADGEALRQENQLQKQTRRQEHQAEVDAFRNQMEQRRRERKSAIEEYQEDPTTEPDTTEPTTTSPETGGNDSQQGSNS